MNRGWPSNGSPVTLKNNHAAFRNGSYAPTQRNSIFFDLYSRDATVESRPAIHLQNKYPGSRKTLNHFIDVAPISDSGWAFLYPVAVFMLQV